MHICLLLQNISLSKRLPRGTKLLATDSTHELFSYVMKHYFFSWAISTKANNFAQAVLDQKKNKGTLHLNSLW